MQKRIAAVYMRGGSSKGVFFHENHLPADSEIRDRIILAVYGSPDPNRRQINGIGGGISSSNKMAIISPSSDPEFDVNYYFGQVNIDVAVIDYRGNCGNLSSAVGPFAVDEGLVKAQEPITTVRIHQVNTGKRIVAEIPVRNGFYNETGSYSIDGVPGTGGKIALHFFEPGGSVTGKLLPTGNVRDKVQVPGVGAVTVSVVDASNPVVFVRAADLGLKGTEISELDAGNDVQSRLERIRCEAAVMIGLARNPEEAHKRGQAFPKIAFVSKAQSYRSVAGRTLQKEKMDFVARAMSLGDLHKAYPVTGSICAAGAAQIEGTVVHEMMAGKHIGDTVRLGHPSGIIELGAQVTRSGNSYTYEKAIIYRTARRMMEGYVLVPETYFRVIED